MSKIQAGIIILIYFLSGFLYCRRGITNIYRLWMRDGTIESWRDRYFLFGATMNIIIWPLNLAVLIFSWIRKVV